MTKLPFLVQPKPQTTVGDLADGLKTHQVEVGVDDEPVAVQSRGESDATLTGLTSGKKARIYVTAVNAKGDEGQPSATVEIQVP